ncbi:MAG TPA: hypothetical protein DCQ26_13410 [Marinilabiliales bacterium]|nr:MAG: hypothetical protein A2W96_15920 [Bacteroidetes bacterium GWD2_40_43]OFX89660.1 MAG: hypothetical protein A2W97_13080 [Bacteroidetes bacterium GWE2_40_63]OFY24177.1 MAG: hypothetical protein A2W88_14515 [Bacteroidetes bacterium GWF2_40_13]OFZ26369.1 MAG: hypothetical protein A2437_03430 [Bacteroidetes bacterium RIFOXYC2_FULL_40_12]HAM99601.1 hypothetical protein [Marinilabiliales bacterium]
MLLYLLIACFVVTFILTAFVRQLAIKKNILDNPNERSSHTVPTPRDEIKHCIGGASIDIFMIE